MQTIHADHEGGNVSAHAVHLVSARLLFNLSPAQLLAATCGRLPVGLE